MLETFLWDFASCRHRITSFLLIPAASLLVHHTPEVIYWIQIWRLRWPLNPLWALSCWKKPLRDGKVCVFIAPSAWTVDSDITDIFSLQQCSISECESKTWILILTHQCSPLQRKNSWIFLFIPESLHHFCFTLIETPEILMRPGQVDSFWTTMNQCFIIYSSSVDNNNNNDN